ncbi:hypothetical protein [Amycolatopsis benzoatilytica]|uniref:hypothetical protein n=1 Tax=Amycolatopsis benzoatilytica TaxID=346045 RepID=UPI000375EBCE|nr:hypothetical protein [Amycolatopsis benzoatilytica]
MTRFLGAGPLASISLVAFIGCLGLSSCSLGAASAANSSPDWITFANGRLAYGSDAQGNRVPDFSKAGYHNGDSAPPDLPVAATVKPQSSGDDTARIQQAIDQVAKSGKPGSVELAAGDYQLSGTLKISTGTVELRGAGSGANGTRLVAAGKVHTLVSISGTGSRSLTGSAVPVTSGYVPVGADRLEVADASALHVGDHVIVARPQEKAWIHAIGMDQIPPRPDGTPSKQWTPNSGLQFDRTITAVNGKAVQFDVPLTNALESQYTHATVQRYTFDGRISESGLAHLSADGSAFEKDPTWHDSGYFNSQLVSVDAAQDSWVDDVVASRFGSAFDIGENALRISLVKTSSLDESVPQDIHAQPAAYTISGQESLIQHCTVTGSNLHAWVTQARVPGPNVISDCTATNTGSRILDAGPHQRWATGTLYDAITMSPPSGRLQLSDRQWMGSGQGWAGANSVLWNCAVGASLVENPPTAHNWAFGCIGNQDKPPAGHQDGEIVSPGKPVKPASLYAEQLAERHAGH